MNRVRSEFEEMPCLRLTCAQAQRLFGLRSDICERVLETLIREGTLWRAYDGRYGVRGESGGLAEQVPMGLRHTYMADDRSDLP